jgi:hypothetical protein
MKSIYTFLVVAIVCMAVPLFTNAQVSFDGLKDKLKFTADVRARAEYDFNYLKSDSTMADDRFRLRSRVRFGAVYQYNEHYSFGLRMRAGNVKDQQSPHTTWGSSGEDAPFSMGIDKAYVKGDYGKWWWSAGKNDFPFYSVADEMFWDADVTPEGFALGGNLKANDHWSFKPTGGYFILENGSAGFLKNDATMGAVQLLATGALSKMDLNVAAGYFAFNNIYNYPDATQTDTLDYGNFVVDLKIGLKTKIPIAFGGDVMINTTDYSADSLIVKSGLQDDKTGFVIFAELGSLKDKGNWLVGLYYSHIEKYAVVDYLAQDDWVRWGFSNGASGTRSSNLGGEEIRLGYAFGPKFNILGRMYLVKGISASSPTSTIEEANRFRIDFNIGF